MGEQLDIFAARAARNRSLDQVKNNSGDFMQRAEAAFADIAWPLEVIGEDIRMALTARGVEPHHHNAWGVFIASLVRRGHLQPTGRLRQMRGAKSHARKTEIYEVMR